MPKPTKKEENTPGEEIVEEVKVVVEEKPKAVPPKPPISRSGPVFPPAHQFNGARGNNMNNRQRPGRAANRGR
ncbi:hypothetical protein COY60_01005 [Candidatus Gracilibacteria bacterium CG_4_10_14_0_8_um_filter_38_28]|nr:MAG: hypothetical protein COY60_01005 [Candidatus Gracilibacteria bacterium CG_4_10_14_0_8_um_filter_38_28]